MKGYNSLPPEMLNQAHLIGQPRMRTESEEIEMMRNALTITVANITGTAYSAMLEVDGMLAGDKMQNDSLYLAKTLLQVSEDTKGDYEETGRRKMRNQLAAQLLFSSLRGGSSPTENLVRMSFSEATAIMARAEEYANEQIEKDKPTSDTIELST